MQLALHREILKRRNSVYAHTDETPLRYLRPLGHPDSRTRWVREPWDGAFPESWSPPTLSMLDGILVLAAMHLESFIVEIEQVRQRIVQAEEAPH